MHDYIIKGNDKYNLIINLNGYEKITFRDLSICEVSTLIPYISRAEYFHRYSDNSELSFSYELVTPEASNG